MAGKETKGNGIVGMVATLVAMLLAFGGLFAAIRDVRTDVTASIRDQMATQNETIKTVARDVATLRLRVDRIHEQADVHSTSDGHSGVKRNQQAILHGDEKMDKAISRFSGLYEDFALRQADHAEMTARELGRIDKSILVLEKRP